MDHVGNFVILGMHPNASGDSDSLTTWPLLVDVALRRPAGRLRGYLGQPPVLIEPKSAVRDAGA